MRSISLIAGCLVLALSTLVLAGNVAADQTTLGPLGLLTETYDVEDGDLLSVNWNSDLEVVFTIVDPDGDLIVTTTDTSYTDTFEAPSTGSFMLTWMNMAFEDNHMTYNVNVVPFALIDDGMDLFWLIVIIGAVGLAAVVVIVLFVVMRRPHHAQPMQAPPQYQVQAYPPPQGVPPGAVPGVPAPTNCVNCWNPIDPQFAFCQRCGARLR
jgi:hypothetical protein